MELEPFNARRVRPGEPVTAQAWNEIVDGVDNVHRYLEAQAQAVRVRVTTPNLDKREVRVTAERADRPRAEGVRPVVPDGEHVVTGLAPGPYTIRADAFGYESATVDIDVEGGAEEQLVLVLMVALDTPVLPDLFGQTLGDVLGTLDEMGVAVARILDMAGQEVTSVAAAAAEYADLPVLGQSPPPGRLAPRSGVQLAVALPARPQAAIEVPDLTGLTEAEARKALGTLGLVLGKVVKKKQGQD